MQLSLSSATRVAFSSLLGVLALAGCAPEQTPPANNTASLDFSRYVAVGDTYTAGFSEGGLTQTSQQYAFPALLDQQLALASGRASTFLQPLLPAGPGSGYLILKSLDANSQPQTRRVTAGRATRGFFANAAACGGPDTTFLYTRAAVPLTQNLGVPYVRLSQIELAGLGNEANLQRIDQFNPYLERQLPAADSRTYLQVVTDGSATATFFTFYMGLSDALPYVLSGGECGTVPSTTLPGQNAKKILDRLTAGGRPGVIGLVPDLTYLPFVNRGSAARVQAQLAPTDTVFIRSSPANVVRAMDARDFVLPGGLTQLGVLQNVPVSGGTAAVRYGLDRRNPLSRRDVLDFNEVNRVNPAITALNTELVRLADKVYLLPTANNKENLFAQVASRISVNGVEYSGEPVRGNFYSLDLYSLTPRGNALLANNFIRAINGFYKTSIPQIDPNTLPTSSRPQ